MEIEKEEPIEKSEKKTKIGTEAYAKHRLKFF